MVLPFQYIYVPVIATMFSTVHVVALPPSHISNCIVSNVVACVYVLYYQIYQIGTERMHWRTNACRGAISNPQGNKIKSPVPLMGFSVCPICACLGFFVTLGTYVPISWYVVHTYLYVAIKFTMIHGWIGVSQSIRAIHWKRNELMLYNCSFILNICSYIRS